MNSNRRIPDKRIPPIQWASSPLKPELEICVLPQSNAARSDCPECDGSVLAVGYMPSVTGYKCQDCSWSDAES
ncbi:hypothetical protein BRD04_09420 [Halobacteriales archaeon QS_9_67_17]|nr:MAG: hypothetical protein BRD04_09420 [Halobacteriales archaeon QS_9_67_17]